MITVFTNGCFDILHRGHIELLNTAKQLGDKLIVGINSDESIRKLKGNMRPINLAENRKFLLENLRAVDEVIIFNEPTPYRLIQKLKPNILVKGGDWKKEEIVGADLVLNNGGEVISLNYVDNYSTTNIINQIICQKN